jgi:hypothetical protein
MESFLFLYNLNISERIYNISFLYPRQLPTSAQHVKLDKTANIQEYYNTQVFNNGINFGPSLLHNHDKESRRIVRYFKHSNMTAKKSMRCSFFIPRGIFMSRFALQFVSDRTLHQHRCHSVVIVISVFNSFMINAVSI